MKILENEWNSYLMNVLPKDAGQVQVEETRQAFYAGAGCLFYAIMATLDPGKDATEADLAKMDSIHKEIDAFLEQAKREAMF